MTVYEQLRRALEGPEFTEDQSPLDPCERLYRALSKAGRESAFGEACAEAVTLGYPYTCVLVRIFDLHPGLSGADGWLDRLRHEPELFPRLPWTLPGDVTNNLRAGALKAALTFRTPPAPDLIEAARGEVLLAGSASGLLYILWNRDRAWVEAHLEQILAKNPDASVQAFGHLVRLGAEPRAALARVLSASAAISHRDFNNNLPRLSADVVAELKASVQAHPDLPRADP